MIFRYNRGAWRSNTFRMRNRFIDRHFSSRNRNHFYARRISRFYRPSVTECHFRHSCWIFCSLCSTFQPCASNPSPRATLGQYDKSAGNKTLTRARSRFSFLAFFPPPFGPLSLFLFFNLSSPVRPRTVPNYCSPPPPTTTSHSLVPLLILSFSLSTFQLGLFFACSKLGFIYEPEPSCMDRGRWPNNE